MVLPIYEIKSLQHSYADKTVLKIEHLTVQPASIVGLIGPNGSGKSTLLRILGLIERPRQGKILFNGREVEPFSDEARFLITVLPQEPFLMKRSVFKNVSYGLKLRGNGSDLIDQVNQALGTKGAIQLHFVPLQFRRDETVFHDGRNYTVFAQKEKGRGEPRPESMVQTCLDHCV